MRIAIDIDGTLCWSNLPVFLEECNTTFELGIATTILQGLTTKEAFYVLPEVANRLVQEEYFCDELAWIEFRRRCLLESLVIDDAVVGVARLACLGEVVYYTARYCDTPDIQQEIEKATKQWLSQNEFINAVDVVFCDMISGKIAEILKIAENDYIILLDDSYQRVLSQIECLDETEQRLLHEKLLLVAVRATAEELPSESNVQMIAFPYWDEIEPVIERIIKHGRQGQAKATEATGDATGSRAGDATPQDPVRTGDPKSPTRPHEAPVTCPSESDLK